jgi:solute carrier family 45, member 1/2/4
VSMQCNATQLFRLAEHILAQDANVVCFITAAGHHGPNVGQAIFSLWMALGSVLGYLAGANAKWHEYVDLAIYIPIIVSLRPFVEIVERRMHVLVLLIRTCMSIVRWFPWLKTAACCDACANLKGAFLTAVVSHERCTTVVVAR